MADTPFTFQEVLDGLTIAKSKYGAPFENMGVRDFARYMNQSLGTTAYRSGDVGKVAESLLMANEGLRDVLAPVSKRTGELGESVGSLFGETGGRIGKSVGEGLPRAGVDIGLLLGATATGGLPAVALGGAALGSAATEAFSQTGSPAAAGVSAATLAGLPLAGKLGGNIAAKTVVPGIEKFIGRQLPNVAARFGTEVGEQAGILGAQEASRQASSLVQGEGFAPITPESIGHEVASNIPFLPFSVPRLARGYKIGGEPGKLAVEGAGFRDLLQPQGEYFPRLNLAEEALKRINEASTTAAYDYTHQVTKATEATAKTKTKGIVTAKTPQEAADLADQLGITTGPAKTTPAATTPAASPAQLAGGTTVPAATAPGGVEQLALPITVSGKPAAKKQMNFTDRELAEEFMRGAPNATISQVGKRWRVEWEGKADIGEDLVARMRTKAEENWTGLDEAGRTKLAGKDLKDVVKWTDLKPEQQGQVIQRMGITWKELQTPEEKKADLSPIDPKTVGANLKSAEAQGATPEAMAASAAVQKQTLAKPEESLGDIAARKAGLPEVVNKPTSPGDFIMATYKFFDNYFDLRGESGPRKEFLMRNAIFLASKLEPFAGKARIGKVAPGEGSSFFAPSQGPTFQAMIGLRVSGTEAMKGNQMMESLRLLYDFAHEAVHSIETDVVQNPEIGKSSPLHAAYQRAWDLSKPLSGREKGDVINTLLKVAIPQQKGEFDYKSHLYKFQKSPELEASEFISDYLGLLAVSMTNAEAQKNVAQYMKYTNEETQTLIGSFMKDLTQSWDAVQEMFKATGFGKSDQVKQIHDNLMEMIKTGQEVDSANDAFRGLIDRMTTSPFDNPPLVSMKKVQKMLESQGVEGFWVRKAEAPEAEMKDFEAKIVGGQRPSIWQRLLPMTQFSRLFSRVPMYKNGVDTVQNVPSLASNASNQMWSHWVDPKTGKWDSVRAEKLGNMKTQLGQAYSFIDLAQQVEERRITGRDLEDMVREKGFKLSSDEVKLIDLSLQQKGGVMREGSVLLQRSIKDTFASTAGLLMQIHSPNMDPNVAERMGQSIANLALVVKDMPALDVLAEQAKIKAAIGNDAAFNAAWDFAQGRSGAISKTLEKLNDRSDWYTSEVRFNKWTIAWKEKGGKRHFEGYDTQEEAQTRYDEIAKRQQKGEVDYLKNYNKDDNREAWQGMPKQAIQAAIDADRALFDAALEKLKAGGADAETLDKFQKEFKPGEGAHNVWTPPYLLERQLVAGREQLNMMEQTFNYVAAVAYGTARRWTRQKIQLIMNHPDLKKENPALRNSLQRYANEMIDAKGREYTTLKNFIFFNNLGFNMASNLINLSQNYAIGAPVLISKGAGIFQAHKLMAEATGILGKAHMKGKSPKAPEFDDPEISKLITRAEEDRVVDKGTTAEMFALDDALAATRRRMTAGDGKVTRAVDLFANPLYHVMSWARNLYGWSEQFNQRAAIIAGYKYARGSLKYDTEASYQFAKDFVKEANYGGGIYNRPELFNGLGKGFGVAGLVYSMAGYTFNTLGVYARFAKEGLEKAKGGKLNTAETRALATMVTTQFMLGGVMGLPLVSGLTALFEQLFPNLELKRTMRETFNTIGGGDDEMGHVFSDLGMSGMFNAVTNTDIGSRFQLGTFMGVDPYKGFSWSQLAGPAGSLIDNFIKAAQAGSTGDFGNAAEKVMPAGLRGLWRMVSEGGGFRDEAGNLIFEPTKAEQLVTAIGFRPKRLNQYYEQQGLIKRSEDIANRERSNLYSRLADEMVKGNVQAVRTGLLEEARQAVTTGNLFDPIAGLEEVVKLAVERNQPKNLYRTGVTTNLSEKSAIASLYPQEEGPSEAQQYMLRKSLERTVPLPGAGKVSPSGLREATVVDQLMKLYPRMTVAEARSLASRTMQRTSNLVGSENPLSQRLRGF